MSYHECKIWTRALAPFQTHCLPVKHTSTDSSLVNILKISFLHGYLFAYFSLLMLGFIMDGANLDGKLKKLGAQISVLTEIDRFSFWFFKVVAKVYSVPESFYGEF